MIYIVIFILVIVVLILLKTMVRISFAKPERQSSINVVNNSYLSTLKAFVSEADYEQIIGKTIFFTAWSSFCKGSIQGIPVLNQLQLKYSDNSKVVFISYCSDLKPSAIPAFLKTYKLKMDYRFLTAGEGLRSSLRTILSRNPDLSHIDPTIDSSNMSFIIDADEKVLYYKGGGLIKNDLQTIFPILDKI